MSVTRKYHEGIIIKELLIIKGCLHKKPLSYVLCGRCIPPPLSSSGLRSTLKKTVEQSWEELKALEKPKSGQDPDSTALVQVKTGYKASGRHGLPVGKRTDLCSSSCHLKQRHCQRQGHRRQAAHSSCAGLSGGPALCTDGL